MELRHRIFAYRIKHNLTQEEFAKILGLSRVNISKLENGRYKPSKKLLMKMDLLEGGE